MSQNDGDLIPCQGYTGVILVVPKLTPEQVTQLREDWADLCKKAQRAKGIALEGEWDDVEIISPPLDKPA